LYNYLFAKKSGGSLILRIEDTDQTRFVPGAGEYITEALQWCGIAFDEGVENGGPYGPYRQSERKDLYKPYAEQLIRQGHAYVAFDTAEELEALRKAEANFQVDASTRMRMKNSLTLGAAGTEALLAAGTPYVIRILIPAGEQIVMQDLIRGEVSVQTDILDDKVLFKSDGMPTYHLANVVDDHLMHISHVIRGEEWLPSAPLHVLLYRYLGWEDSMPRFAHLPLLLRPDGNGKLSKRDGDRLGFPVFPLKWKDPHTGETSSGYREAGFLPQAFVNFLALLGWNPGTEQELFSMEDLVNAFTLDRVQKAGARFDYEKAKWFNQQYLKDLPPAVLAGSLAAQTGSGRLPSNEVFLEKACDLVRERITFLTDLPEATAYFFEDPASYDSDMLKKRWKDETPGLIAGFSALLEEADFTDPEILEGIFKQYVETNRINSGAVLAPLRMLLTGRAGGPGVFQIMSLIGKETTLRRLNPAHYLPIIPDPLVGNITDRPPS